MPLALSDSRVKDILGYLGCPRLPEEFWREAMQTGFGGTRCESNLAF